jgi:hypothetical protein
VSPASRWAPSPRRRPDRLPEPKSFYPAGCGSDLRIIDGQRIRVERRDGGLAVFYCWKQFRRLSHDQLLKGRIL